VQAGKPAEMASLVLTGVPCPQLGNSIGAGAASSALTLSAEEAPVYAKLWEEVNAPNGLLPAASAVKFFGTSQLPNADLRDIWTLSDSTPVNGKLSRTEFFVALKLIAVVRGPDWFECNLAARGMLLEFTRALGLKHVHTQAPHKHHTHRTITHRHAHVLSLSLTLSLSLADTHTVSAFPASFTCALTSRRSGEHLIMSTQRYTNHRTAEGMI
jgi:hypothetical protein